MEFSITDFFSKCDQIRRKLRIWSHLLKKSVMENFIFCSVHQSWLFSNSVINMPFSKWKENDAKITSFHSKTWVKICQIPKKLLNDHFITVIIQKVIRTKLVKSWRAYVRKKNKMIKMQHNTLYTLTKKWFDYKFYENVLLSGLWKMKQGSLIKTKLNFLNWIFKWKLTILISFNFFRHDWQVSSLTHIWNNLK